MGDLDDVRSRLAVAQAATAALIAAVPPDAWGASTPCTEWDVAGLVRHLVAGERIFEALVLYGEADRATILPAAGALPPAELSAAYDAATAGLRAAYASPGAMDRSYVLPIGELPADVTVELRTTESLAHGWDLQQALGTPLEVDPALVEHAIEASTVLLAQLPPGRKVFGAPQPVADDAPPLDRLAALLGRTVTT